MDGIDKSFQILYTPQYCANADCKASLSGKDTLMLLTRIDGQENMSARQAERGL